MFIIDVVEGAKMESKDYIDYLEEKLFNDKIFKKLYFFKRSKSLFRRIFKKSLTIA